MTDPTRGEYLVFRAGGQLCGLPLEHIVETMRPQPVRPVAGMPMFVRGLTKIRGAAVPVVDAAAVLDGSRVSPNPSRFVAIKADGRRIALAVDEVVGIRSIASSSLAELPPLLDGARTSAASNIGVLDHELMLVLQSGRFIPDAVWKALEPGESR